MLKKWAFINNLMGKTHNKKSCIDSLKVNDGYINDHKEIAREFCNFFTNVGKENQVQYYKL